MMNNIIISVTSLTTLDFVFNILNQFCSMGSFNLIESVKKTGFFVSDVIDH